METAPHASSLKIKDDISIRIAVQQFIESIQHRTLASLSGKPPLPHHH
jgi:hypothetical protein